MITQENIPYTADEIRAMVKTCERYNKALERARNYHDNFGVSLILEDIFPELRENEEDEKIRKVLIGFFNRFGRYKEQAPHGSRTFHGIPTDDIIAWLEKQGKQVSMSADKVRRWLEWNNKIHERDEILGKPELTPNDEERLSQLDEDLKGLVSLPDSNAIRSTQLLEKLARQLNIEL